MAELAPLTDLSGWIDDYLDYLLREWAGVPEVADEWDDWDEMSRLTFVIDCGVPADRLHQLQGWAAQGVLTPAQQARYDDLLSLVERHRPTLERLLAE